MRSLETWQVVALTSGVESCLPHYQGMCRHQELLLSPAALQYVSDSRLGWCLSVASGSRRQSNKEQRGEV